MPVRKSVVMSALVIAGLGAAACSSTPEARDATAEPIQSVASPTPTDTARQAPPDSEPASLTVVVASTDLAVGPNRFVFGVLDGRNPIRTLEARMAFVHVDSDESRVVAQGVARFATWPAGSAGVYVGDVSFDRPGRWGVIVQVDQVAGSESGIGQGQSGFVVKTESSASALGRRPPLSLNKTAQEVSDLGELTSSVDPDVDLYQLTVADAVSSGKPTVVTFATPAFCQTLTCGPQVEVVSAVKGRHKGEANFIHVEVFDNPAEMAGDPSRGRLSPLMQEWGLLTEPFTFVLDGGGLVSSKFEGFVTEAELESALAAVLSP